MYFFPKVPKLGASSRRSGQVSVSLPEVDVQDHHLFGEEVPDDTLTIRDLYVTTRYFEPKTLDYSGNSAIPKTIKVGLFRNQKLLAWAEPCAQPENFHGFEDRQFYRLPDMTEENLTTEDKLQFAALVTDSFGRQFIASDVPYVVNYETDRDHPYLTHPSDGRYNPDPANWEF